MTSRLARRNPSLNLCSHSIQAGQIVTPHRWGHLFRVARATQQQEKSLLANRDGISPLSLSCADHDDLSPAGRVPGRSAFLAHLPCPTDPLRPKKDRVVAPPLINTITYHHHLP